MAWSDLPIVGAGTKLPASFLTKVRDNLKAVGDPWTPYTPSLGNWTLGNGTLTGRFRQTNKTVDFYAHLQLGSTSAATNASPTFGLPRATLNGNTPFQAIFWRSASVFYVGAAYTIVNLSTITPYLLGTNNQAAQFTTASPFTWASGDQIRISGSYETP